MNLFTHVGYTHPAFGKQKLPVSPMHSELAGDFVHVFVYFSLNCNWQYKEKGVVFVTPDIFARQTIQTINCPMPNQFNISVCVISQLSCKNAVYNKCQTQSEKKWQWRPVDRPTDDDNMSMTNLQSIQCKTIKSRCPHNNKKSTERKREREAHHQNNSDIN